MKKTLLLFFLLYSTFSLKAQYRSNVGLKFMGLSIHPLGGNGNEVIMPNKLDPQAHFVVNLGAILSYEHFLYKDIVSVKALQGLYADCAVQLAGFSSIGIRARIFRLGRHSLYGGLGPTIIFRRNWFRLEGYQDSHYFKGDKDDYWQYRFLWYGGEFEYKVVLRDQIDFSISFVPGYPDLMSLSMGISYNF
ncbi:hypothetical protein [Porphyromonas gingivicanis]|uniref:hypothetical protein n=1 Tax=Porphyromonas gingivicanis TaxID=266762 RepID=UPI0004705E77|nr:hypothetical protein [Porphyromonas gingivicanis]